MSTSMIPDLSNSSLRKQPRGPNEERSVPNRILNLGVLVTQAQEILNAEAEKISKGDRHKAIKDKYRTQYHFERTPLETILGEVNPEIWSNIVRNMLKGMVKTITNSQNNGDWKVLEGEVGITPDQRGNDVLVVAVRWVDMFNQQDMQYRNGQPAVNVMVSNNIPTELIEALTAKSASAGGDAELKELLKQLMVLMAAQMAGNAKPSKGTEDEAKV